MKPGDLMMLGEGATLYSKDGEKHGELGDIVTVIRRSNHHDVVRVLHPTLGRCAVFAHQLHPMTGGSNEAG